MRRIFGTKRVENREWRRLHNGELHCLYCSPNIVRVKIEMACHIYRMEEGRTAFKILAGTSTGKRFLGRPKRRWEYNIRMVLK